MYILLAGLDYQSQEPLILTDDKYLNIDIYIVALKNENGIAFNGNHNNIFDQHAVGMLNASRNLFYHERLV